MNELSVADRAADVGRPLLRRTQHGRSRREVRMDSVNQNK